MIRARSSQALLAYASTRLSHGAWRPLHEGARHFYLGPALSMLSRLIRPSGISSEDFRLSARHSSLSSQDFNLFQSDLDLKIVLHDEAIANAGDSFDRYCRWKRILPFLGELEIYSESESRELEQLFVEARSFYPMIRSIRKLSWMEESAERALSRYHLLKAERSISKILANAGVTPAASAEVGRKAFSERVQSWLEKELGPEALTSRAAITEGPIFSDYLATELRPPSQASLGKKTLELPAGHLLALLSLTPRARFEPAGLNEEIRRLRRIASIQERWKTTSKIECLVFRAVLRAQKHVSEGDRSWNELFINSLSSAERPL